MKNFILFLSPALDCGVLAETPRGLFVHLSKAGWSWGCVSAIDSCGRTIWVADAHRGDGNRFVHAEKLTAFLEFESAIRAVSP
jgi:hypothetical protein